eukprot:TRINITY_DN6614_c0_g1_i1.p1 TRINITY_DN6614_c0_g1~~TRINITY_DN6614_c0_g1_i1.p1  ORF type:complete len:764 (-),score=152.25 TRINITY_DN6614_c0_g1_i1:155-2446(-)
MTKTHRKNRANPSQSSHSSTTQKDITLPHTELSHITTSNLHLDVQEVQNTSTNKIENTEETHTDTPSEQTVTEDTWETKDVEEINTEKSTPSQATELALNSLEIVYPDGSWKPETSGLRTYNREFLLKFQPICLERPKDMPSVEVLLDLDKEDPKSQPFSKSRYTQTQRIGTSPITRKNQDFNQKSRTSQIPRLQDPKDRWARKDVEHKPSHDTKDKWRPTDGTENKVEQVDRLAISYLNKITPENFNSISEKILKILTTDQTLLEKVVALVYDKALIEPKFASMYGDLCSKMNQRLESLPSPSDTNSGKDFKLILLNKCQVEFENRPSQQLDDSSEVQEELNFKRRARIFGNINFIGELFKKRMLSEKVMHFCIKTLMANGEISKISTEDAECLCRLLTIIGSQIDSLKASRWMNEYFNLIRTMSQSKQFESRIRFSLEGLIELRLNRWIPRLPNEKPKTLKEIHQQAEAHRSTPAIIRPFVKPVNESPRPSQMASPAAPVDEWSTVVRSKPSTSKQKEVQAPVPSQKKTPLQPKVVATHKSQPKPQARAQIPRELEREKEVPKQESAFEKKKVEALLQEYLNNRSLEDAAECVVDLNLSESSLPSLISFLTSFTLEAKPSDQLLLEDLLEYLYKSAVFTQSQVLEAVREQVETLPDVKIDIPKAPVVLGRVFGKLLRLGALPFHSLNLVTDDLKQYPRDLESLLTTMLTSLDPESVEVMNSFENRNTLIRSFEAIGWSPARLVQSLTEFNMQPFARDLVSQ